MCEDNSVHTEEGSLSLCCNTDFGKEKYFLLVPKYEAPFGCQMLIKCQICT